MRSTTLQIEKRMKGQDTGDRRTSPRYESSAIPNLKSINQIGGPEVKLINISRSGALIEGPERMSPGSVIWLQIVTTGAVYHLKGHVVCSTTSSMNDQSFQSAIAFDRDFTVLP